MVTTRRVGTDVAEMPVGAFNQPEKAAAADVDANKQVSQEEAAAYYAQATGGKKMDDLNDFVKLASGLRHNLGAWLPNLNRYIEYGNFWKGDFHIEGLGYGHVNTRHNVRDVQQPDGTATQVSTLLFVFDCDGFDKRFLREGIEKADLILAPKGFPNVSGTDVTDSVAVPLDRLIEDGYYIPGGYRQAPTDVPDAKYLAAELTRSDLAQLAGNTGGVSFCVRLTLKDGSERWVNLDGVAGKNFELDSEQEFGDLSARATPSVK